MDQFHGHGFALINLSVAPKEHQEKLDGFQTALSGPHIVYGIGCLSQEVTETWEISVAFHETGAKEVVR